MLRDITKTRLPVIHNIYFYKAVQISKNWKNNIGSRYLHMKNKILEMLDYNFFRMPNIV